MGGGGGAGGPPLPPYKMIQSIAILDPLLCRAPPRQLTIICNAGPPPFTCHAIKIDKTWNLGIRLEAGVCFRISVSTGTTVSIKDLCKTFVNQLESYSETDKNLAR